MINFDWLKITLFRLHHGVRRGAWIFNFWQQGQSISAVDLWLLDGNFPMMGKIDLGATSSLATFATSDARRTMRELWKEQKGSA